MYKKCIVLYCLLVFLIVFIPEKGNTFCQSKEVFFTTLKKPPPNLSVKEWYVFHRAHFNQESGARFIWEYKQTSSAQFYIFDTLEIYQPHGESLVLFALFNKGCLVESWAYEEAYYEALLMLSNVVETPGKLVHLPNEQ